MARCARSPPNQRVYTYFDASAKTEMGKAQLELVVDGIASTPVSITVE